MGVTTGYRHEALVYRGPAEFQQRVSEFLRVGARRAEPMLVAVREPRLSRLRESMAGERRSIEFVDMAQLGGNPAAIIPRWLRFVEESRGRPVRGVGEPIWSSRSPEELFECQVHEALLNLAVPAGTSFRLLCPYDRAALPEPVLRECEAAHPWLSDESGDRRSARYAAGHVRDLLRRPLPEPTPAVTPATAPAAGVFEVVRARAQRLGGDPGAVRRFAAVLTDMVEECRLTDPGPVRWRVWRDGDRLTGEVSTRRALADPLLGRRPAAPAGSGRGLWLANHVCDLTQLRGDERGTVMRMQVRV